MLVLGYAAGFLLAYALAEHDLSRGVGAAEIVHLLKKGAIGAAVGAVICVVLSGV